uniref:Putative ovule protein n=1 Tax=Solanum chacoense TaxID=4108 RepID=A0A0V0H6J6_SOLCH
MWLLSSATPIGWLNRMIQFKEKSRKAVRCCCMQPCLHRVSIFQYLNFCLLGLGSLYIFDSSNLFEGVLF